MLKFCPKMTRNSRLQNISLRLDETSLEQNRVAKNTGMTLCAPNYQSLFNQYLSTCCPQNITSSQRPALCSLHLWVHWGCHNIIDGNVLSSDHSAPPPCATQACLVFSRSSYRCFIFDVQSGLFYLFFVNIAWKGDSTDFFWNLNMRGFFFQIFRITVFNSKSFHLRICRKVVNGV